MVNANSIQLLLTGPRWLSDEVAIAIARRLKKQGFEIDRKMSEDSNTVMYALKRADGARTSSKWYLVIRYLSPLFGGEVEWKVINEEYFKRRR